MSSLSATEELPPALKEACTTGHLPLVTSLYADLIQTKPASKPSTLSQMAILSAKNAHPAILSFCFSSGLTLQKDKVNDPLIHAACDSASIPIFAVLIDEGGMSVNHYLELGGDPLTSAVYNGNVELAEFLLQRGADPSSDYPLGNYSALVWAVVGDANQGDAGE